MVVGDADRSKHKTSKFAIIPQRSNPRLVVPVVPTPAPISVDHLRSVDASPLLYELVVSQKLPTVNLANTLLSMNFSVRMQESIAQTMQQRYRVFVWLHRLGSVGCFVVLLAEDERVRTGLALVCTAGMFPVVATTLFLSTDIIRVLTGNYEFWFITALNVLHWACFALLLRDVRVLNGIGSWLAIQTVIVIDANYRTFPAATRSVVVAIPSMIAVGICCAIEEIQGAHFAPVVVNGIEVYPGDIVVFTTSTLVIFMAKKIFLKSTRMHQAFSGCHPIPCVVIRASLKYAIGRQIHHRSAITESNSTISRQLQVQQHTQTLRSSSRSLMNLKPKRILVPLKFFLKPWKKWQIRFLYLIGAVGFVCTSIAWVLALSETPSSSLLVSSSIAGVACTFVFVVTFGAMLQHEVMYAMIFNFDFVFSAVQVYLLTLCLASMLRWHVHRSLAVFSWCLWFQWMLCQDGLMPIVKRRLRYKKRYAAPVMVMVLLGLVPLLMRMFDDDSNLFVDHVVFDIQISASHDYTLHVKAVALQRIVTILCWSTRLVYGLATTLEEELLFIRGSVEYMSPFNVFSG